MINRSPSNKSIPINIVGSSIFGRYPKMSSERTVNMFISDNWMVPYSGYQTAIAASKFSSSASTGRGVHTSTKLNKLIVVIDSSVYVVDIFFNQTDEHTINDSVTFIGSLNTSEGAVSISENNRPQIAICDGIHIY